MHRWTLEEAATAIDAALQMRKGGDLVTEGRLLVEAYAAYLTTTGFTPGDVAVPQEIRKLFHTLETKVRGPAVVEATRAAMGTTPAVFAARKGVSRRERAPDDVRECVLPWFCAERNETWPAVLTTLRAVYGDHLPVGTEMASAAFCLAWEETKQVFRISPAFADMLARTEVSGIRPIDFAFPYDTFYIAIPGCTRQEEDGIGGGSLAIAGIGVQVEDVGVVTAAGDAIPGPSVRIIIWCPPPLPYKDTAVSRLDDYFRVASLPFGIFYTEDPEAELAKLQAWASRSSTGRIAPDIEWALRVVVNLVLYTNSVGAEMAPASEMAAWAASRRAAAGKKNLAKRARALRGLPDFTLTDLAPSIRGDAARDDDDDGALDADRHRPRRHWVRGHWTHQAHGPQHTLRRLQWVRPHLRGGLEGDAPRARIYSTGDAGNIEKAGDAGNIEKAGDAGNIEAV